MSLLQLKPTQAYQLGLRLNTLHFTILCKFQTIISLFSYPQNSLLRSLKTSLQEFNLLSLIALFRQKFINIVLFLYHFCYFQLIVKHFRGTCMSITNANMAKCMSQIYTPVNGVQFSIFSTILSYSVLSATHFTEQPI